MVANRNFYFSIFFTLLVLCNPSQADQPECHCEKPSILSADMVDAPVEASNGLHRSVIKAAVKMQKEGKLSRLDLIRLRVAMLSPSFRDRVEDLAVVQILSSPVDEVPFDVSEDGSVDRASIDWDKLMSFLERLVPLILILIKAFGGI